MHIEQVRKFAQHSKSDPYLASRLKACMQTKELFALAREQGYYFDKHAVLNANKSLFSEDQLSSRLIKLLSND